MDGGRLARGDELDISFSTQNSGTGSSTVCLADPHEQGSVVGHIEDEVDQQSYRNIEVKVGTSSFTAWQNSNGSVPFSRNSRSNKRKCTNKVEPSSKGRKSQRARNEETECLKRIAENSAEMASAHSCIVRLMKQLLTVKQRLEEKSPVTESAEIAKCCERLNALNISRSLRNLCMREFLNSGTRMIFLYGQDDDVWQWINITFGQGSNPSSGMNQQAPNTDNSL